MKKRVVIDSSTLLSAAIRPGSTPDRALRRALAECDVCASIDTLAELDEVLARPKFDQYLGVEARLRFMTVVHENFQIFSVAHVDPTDLNPSCRDPRDNKFLATAQMAHADVIVSSDEDLLVLHPWRGIPILTPAEFLARLEDSIAAE